MFSTILAFLSQKILLIGAFMGSLYVLWLKRSERKAKEDAKDAHFVSVQAQATQDQVETLVEKAQDVMDQQQDADCQPCDRGSINRWLSKESNVSSADSVSKGVDAKAISDDTANISNPTSKTR